MPPHSPNGEIASSAFGLLAMTLVYVVVRPVAFGPKPSPSSRFAQELFSFCPFVLLRARLPRPCAGVVVNLLFLAER